MKPKYSIGETVRIKATGEKVKIGGVFNEGPRPLYQIFLNNPIYFKWFEESELKPYRPSRTGKFRNAKGQFMSAIDKAAQEQREHFSYEDVSDSNQRNYQKILTKLVEIEKKIDIYTKTFSRRAICRNK